MNPPVNAHAKSCSAASSASTALSVVFRPAYGKTHGDISRQLRLIETVITASGGTDFAIHPHDSAAYCFTLGLQSTSIDAESVVAALNGLRDVDGASLVDAEQGEARAVAKPVNSVPPAEKKQAHPARIL